MSVHVRILRACLCNGGRLEAGAVVALDEGGACDLLDAGKAALIDEADGPMLRVFRLARVRKTLRDLGPMPQPAGSPWGPWSR